jgi:FdhE protein
MSGHDRPAGDLLGGVSAPEPLVLPDPSTRFARTAARLDFLAAGHPMAEWLRFIARLCRAQHEAAIAAPPPSGPSQAEVEQAVAARRPPLATDAGRRDPAWRHDLAVLLSAFDDPALPPPARAAIAGLRSRDAAGLEAMANAHLQDTLEPAETGAALFVAAALQVCFTRQAAALPAASLRLLERRGLCPCCGSAPVAGLITAGGRTPGTRYLHCGLCSTAWNHVRAVCITCGEARSLGLREIEGGAGAVKAEICDLCGTYAKMLYQPKDMQLDPVADDLATLGLDLLVAQAGWSRHALNPLLPVSAAG